MKTPPLVLNQCSMVLSRMNIPFQFEKNIYWRRLSRSLPQIAVEGTIELASLIVDAVSELVRGRNGKLRGRRLGELNGQWSLARRNYPTSGGGGKVS
ncbi:unnamed protein product [Linum trigynum]|uniref:Uncharacterized protein n=1 Tax=Linum trigynum TaxID=586398 RepID=A0AAV2GKP8_9ROSI